MIRTAGFLNRYKYFTKNILNKTPRQTVNSNAITDNYDQEKHSDSFAPRLFQNFISPGYISEEVTDDVFLEISRLYNKTGEGKVIISKQEK